MTLLFMLATACLVGWGAMDTVKRGKAHSRGHWGFLLLVVLGLIATISLVFELLGFEIHIHRMSHAFPVEDRSGIPWVVAVIALTNVIGTTGIAFRRLGLPRREGWSVCRECGRSFLVRFHPIRLADLWAITMAIALGGALWFRVYDQIGLNLAALIGIALPLTLASMAYASLFGWIQWCRHCRTEEPYFSAGRQDPHRVKRFLYAWVICATVASYAALQIASG